MKKLLNITFALLLASALLVGCGEKGKEVKPNKIPQPKINIEKQQVETIGDNGKQLDQQPEKPLEIKWSTPVKLNSLPNESAFTSLGGMNSIKVDGNVVHVAWESSLSGKTSNVYYTRSLNSGVSWESGTKLTDNVGRSKSVSINANGDDVLIVWVDDRDNKNGEIYYIQSDDGGKTWSKDTRLTNDDSKTTLPSIAVIDDVFYLTWEDYIPKCSGHFAKSYDGGKTWSQIELVTDNGIEVGIPNIAEIDKGSLHLIYGSEKDSEETKGYNWENYYRYSNDQGKNWSEPIRLTDDEIGDTRFPHIASDGNVLHTVWWDDRDDTNYKHFGYPEQFPSADHNYEIYYKRSLDGGKTWEEDTRLTNDGAVSQNPSIAVVENNVYVAWVDNRNGSNEVYAKYSSNAGTSWGDEVLLSKDLALSERITIKANETGVYLIWTTQESEKEYNVYFVKGNIE
ncbi:glycoside hydrolase [Patescibacteria group bacterium]|nr:glycoside hydrolase [Patescibacteria group bacterium]